MTEAWREIRVAVRVLARAPSFSAVVAATLALGIGGTTAVFSVLDAVLLRALPYPEAEAVVSVHRSAGEAGVESSIGFEDLRTLRGEEGLFEEIAGWWEWRPTLSTLESVEVVPAAFVSEGMFEGVLGVQPSLGRSFLSDEYGPDGTRAAVLSHAFWLDRFGGDPSALGRALRLDGEPYTVVGVMPPGFRSPSAGSVALWASARSEGARCLRPCEPMRAFGRLSGGVGLEVASARSLTAVRAAEEARRGRPSEAMVILEPLRSELLGSLPEVLWGLLAACAVVLVIACTNVAGLFLARGLDRDAEFAVRRALGAQEGVIVRQLLVESMVLSVVGGLIGLGLAVWGTEALLLLAPSPLPGIEQLTFDARVLGFSAAVTLGTGLLFGLVPALRLSRLGAPSGVPWSARKAPSLVGGRGTARERWLATQVALATVLAVTAGLLVRNLSELGRADLGIDPRGLVEIALEPHPFGPGGARGIEEERAALEERLRALPGVVSVGSTSASPVAEVAAATWEVRAAPEEGRRTGDRGASQRDVVSEGRVAASEGTGPAGPVTAAVARVTPGYFYTVGQRILEGRGPTASDRARGSPAVFLSQTLARRLFGYPRNSGLGRSVILGTGPGARELVVAGVVADVRTGPRTQPRPTAYVWSPGALASFASEPARAAYVLARVEERAAPEPSALKALVSALAPGSRVTIRGVSDVLADAVSLDRFVATLSVLFAALALVMAAVGHFGLLSHAMARRVRELGIRVAIGAEARDVRGIVLRAGLLLSIPGIVIGLAASVGIGELLASFLHRIGPRDALSFGGALLALAVSTGFATWLPSWRAGRIDPVSVVREE